MPETQPSLSRVTALLSHGPGQPGGGALLGWIAGEIAASDPLAHGLFTVGHELELMAALAGAAAD